MGRVPLQDFLSIAAALGYGSAGRYRSVDTVPQLEITHRSFRLAGHREKTPRKVPPQEPPWDSFVALSSLVEKARDHLQSSGWQ